jgi:hypothetical protein
MVVRTLALAAGLGLFVSGCGSGDAKGSSSDSTSSGPLTELSAYDWKIAPSVEAYYCVFKTLTEDLYISEFHPLIPAGTHHVVIGYQDPKQTDGTYPEDGKNCTGVTFGDIFMYVATPGAQEFKMPEGVAEKIPAGKQLVFGLHVINTTDAPLQGHSGVEIVSAAPPDAQHEAEVVAVMPPGLSVPPGPSTANGTCTATGDSTVFAVSPHMHLTGVHMKTTAGPPSATGQVLIDEKYDFTNQHILPVAPLLHMSKGDQIHVECDYQNPTADTLTTGESTTKNEMCITFAYRYPALSQNAPVSAVFPRGYCLN